MGACGPTSPACRLPCPARPYAWPDLHNSAPPATQQTQPGCRALLGGWGFAH